MLCKKCDIALRMILSTVSLSQRVCLDVSVCHCRSLAHLEGAKSMASVARRPWSPESCVDVLPRTT